MNNEVKTINGYDIKDVKAVRTYDTVALLKADRKLKQGQHVKTRGYYSINDGGSAEYYITSTQSELDYQENLENGLYATLIINNPKANVKQFGAYGDGTHDDVTAIQNAIDYCFANGIDLFIPSTNDFYKITSPLVLTANPDGGLIDRWWAGNGCRLFGEYKTYSKIIKIGNTTSGIEDYDVNATIICKTELGTGINIENLTLANYTNTDLDTYDNSSYALYTKCSRSNYKDLNINAYHGIYGECFSCNFENILFNCDDTALDISNGTSNTFRFMYSPYCNNPYKIQSSYSTLMNCASDQCTGSIYRLSGVGLTLLNCGCESKKAQYIIEQLNSTWFDVTVQGMMIDRQIGDTTNNLSINDCSIVYICNEGSIKLRDCIIIERDLISEGNSYVFKLNDNGYRFNTVVDNLNYYKNFIGTNNTRMKLWNNYRTAGYTPHKFSSGGMDFNYQLIGEGKVVPFIGCYDPVQDGSMDSDSLVQSDIKKKAIYLDHIGRYETSNGNTQYIGRPNLGDIHIFNDPLLYNALGQCVTNITNSSIYSLKKIPIVISATTTDRPTSNLYEGLCIFDTTLKKPIWYDGSTWRDSTGTSV